MNKDGLLILVYFVISFCFGFLVAFGIYANWKPSAMDVYQGNTTLEITYKDGIPVDSVVVFKDKEK